MFQVHKAMDIVMLVDDNDTDNFISKRIIEITKFSERVVVKNSGQGALEYLRENENIPDNIPSIIFLDINMPVVDGFIFLYEFDKFNEPLDALVMETDSPDIPPHWLYTTAADRALGVAQGRNEPGELPRIAQQVADLRGITLQALAVATTANALHALPKLAVLLKND